MADPSTLYLLTAVNAALYLLLFYQVRGRRLRGTPSAPSATDAFSLLGAELRRAIPSMQPGFTWREGLAEARRLGLRVDWGRVGEEVGVYEKYRYGGGGAPSEFGEVLVLTRELRGVR